MSGRRAIDLALGLARMPALARTAIPPPVPHDVAELMRIAATHPPACQAAAALTGEPNQVLVEAARFYIQQVLLRPDADCYRILGIDSATSRATARNHMRWLLQWLHPDHNGSWDTVYAERVLKAWREVCASNGLEVNAAELSRPYPQRQNSKFAPVRLPWIEQPIRRSKRHIGDYVRAFLVWGVPATVAMVALWSVFDQFGQEMLGVIIPR